jgi:hypothetical protein
MDQQGQRPFDLGYVVRATVKHMRKSVRISIDKTFARISEFEGDGVKSAEVLRTLSVLHEIDKQLESIQTAHPENPQGE